jgi:hypothetical protein
MSLIELVDEPGLAQKAAASTESNPG